MKFVATMLLLVALTGCVTVQPYSLNQTASSDETMPGVRTAEWPPVLKTGMPKDIRTAAIAAARGDIADGKPRIAFTGGFASWPIGLSADDFKLVKDLPRVPLPCGCTEPLLQQASIYAEAYNKEILPYIKSIYKPTQ